MCGSICAVFKKLWVSPKHLIKDDFVGETWTKHDDGGPRRVFFKSKLSVFHRYP